MLAAAGRLWRTVRHLKPVQIYGRVWFRLYRPRPSSRPISVFSAQSGKWADAARRQPSLLGLDRFCFLNEIGDLSDGWNDPSKAKLWRYNLHYFDDLNGANSTGRTLWHVALINRWVQENPVGDGAGWEPYTVSLRLVNWIKWALSGNTLSAAATASIAVQARWLSKKLEWHILGNHLFANAKALVFAGLFFDDAEANGWLRTGTNIIIDQLDEQILPDGAQFELSPMYHALAVEDLLDLINITNIYPAKAKAINEACRLRIPAMLHWLNAVCHPDGEVAFFNDTAIGVAPASAEIRSYARRLGFSAEPQSLSSEYFKHSGYARLHAGSAVIIADVGRIGPDYLPGHAHADTLSFELSLGQERVFVNSGTSLYGISEERIRQRGSAAHNTVVVEGRDSSEVWSGFRVGRRANAKVSYFDGLSLKASHDGYHYLPSAPVHHREWDLSQTGLTISDHLSSDVSAEARYHLHPSVTAEQTAAGAGRLLLANSQIVHWETPGAECHLEPSSWHPEFGLSIPNTVLRVPVSKRAAVLKLHWDG